MVIEDLVGLTAARCLGVFLSSLKEVREVFLATCSPLPLLQDRFEMTELEREICENANDLRRNLGLSFWSAALIQLSDKPDAVRLLDAATMHVSLRGRERRLSWSEVNAGGIELACEEFEEGAAVSLTMLSEVVLRDGSLGHIPMLDFHSPKSVQNQWLVEAAAQRILPEGSIIMESGESYHAYGTRILSQAEFQRFLGNALLLAPIVDRAYIAHQLIEGRCALRLTQGGGKSRVPTVVAVLPRG